MKKNSIQILRKQLNKQKKQGLFDNPSPIFLQEVENNITSKVTSYFNKLLRRNNSYFINGLKKNFYKYKNLLTNRHKLRSYRLSDLNPAFKTHFDNQRFLALSLIKSQNEENMLKLKRRFMDWVTLKNVGNDKETLAQLTKIPSNKKVKFILKDQTNKMNANFDKTVSDFYGGALAFQWKINNDNRVVGKPGGKYPKANKDSKTHGDHWHRKDKWYFNPEKRKYLISEGVDLKAFEGDYNSNKDGMPGIPIGCRCWAYYVYELEDLPKNFVKNNKKK